MKRLILIVLIVAAAQAAPEAALGWGRGGVRVGGYSGVGVPVVGWYGAGVGMGVGNVGYGYIPGLPVYAGPVIGGGWGGWGYWGGYPWWNHPRYNGWHNGYWPRWGGAVMPQSNQFVRGLSQWALGSAMYASGYSSYSNPYYRRSAGSTAGSDYSRPVSMLGSSGNGKSPATPDDEAMRLFDEARRQFRSGGYERALQLVNSAIAKMPQDTVMQEFKSLALFALGRYEQSAATIHSVLASSPGWDWTTLSNLYFSNDIYRYQLRKLENYANSSSGSADAQFLLAYHYLTMGHDEQAAAALRKVIQLKPNDELAQRLLAIADPAAAEAAAESAPPLGRAPAGDELIGHWQAQREPDGVIDLQLSGDGKFRWTFRHSGKSDELSGNYSLGDKTLSLEVAEGAEMVGNIGVTPAGELVFRLIDAVPSDPGITFVRQRQ